MNDQDCVEFLRWCLPRLQYRWKGFRRVRRQICKRLRHRLLELELSNLNAYRSYLKEVNDEWKVLDSLCSITISRFYRNRSVFYTIQSEILPLLAETNRKRNEKEIRCWSAGCCSGEEPYTLSILWNLAVPKDLKDACSLRIVATDRESILLKRAECGIYSRSSLKDLPEEWIDRAFDRIESEYRFRETLKHNVVFLQQDIREQCPPDNFDLILCRNIVFTYFSEELQSVILKKIIEKLKSGGFLIVGAHESLPCQMDSMIPYGQSRSIYRKARKL